MPKRALAQKRPFLLLSILAALAFYYLRVSALPELYLIPLRGSAVGLLAVYAFMRHSSPDAQLYVWALGAAAMGDMALEIDVTIGGLVFFLHHVLAMGLFLKHRRPVTGIHSWICGVTLISVPVVGYLLPYDPDEKLQVGLYTLALGAMAAAAWASSFPRFRVGAGALLVVVSDLTFFADMGPLSGKVWPQLVIWPLYYLGMFLMCTGVTQTLCKRDPQLRAVK